MRYARRVDRNHTAVIQALRDAGWHVFDTARLGGGFPDCVAARRGELRLIEIKDGTKPPSERKLTDDEADVMRGFGLAGVTVHVLESVQDAVCLE